MITLPLPDEIATRALGAALAPLCRPGDMIALYGDLGAGKTTLSRGLIAALCGAGTEVPSPTYTLLQTYDAPALTIYHFDLYRIENPAELVELGWDDTQSGLALVEWPEHAGARLPAWHLALTLTKDAAMRKAKLEAHGEDWQNRLHEFAV